MIGYTKTRYSNKFYFYKNDNTIGRSLDLYGEYSETEVSFLLSILNDQSVVYDIGSNIGYHTSAFASIAKKVYSFEPNFLSYDLLVKNTQQNKNVICVNAAVNSNNGIVSVNNFDIDVPGNYGSVSINNGETSVISIKIDDFGFEPPNLIKIDVEGAEYDVFKSCERTITNYRPIVYWEAHETPNIPEIYHFLKKENYFLYWCQINNYNQSNFKNNNINVFGNTALFSILSVPFKPLNLNLDEVIGPDDTYQALNKRVEERNK